ncbi:MAG: outer membrane lipoprotein-sorting protein [Deltaproteobacteria bacterium]|nr:outer membrane lipoprotein-sorting protein [Deltaproteobacteria bacterium]
MIQGKSIVLVLVALISLGLVVSIPGMAYAWKAVRPIMGTGVDEGKVVGWKDEEIPDDRLPLGVNEVPEAVGVFGYPKEAYGLNITPTQAGIDTTRPLLYTSEWSGQPESSALIGSWAARDYVQFQTSYQGMEVKPLQDYAGDLQIDLIDKNGRVRTRKVYQFRKPYYGEDGIRYKSLVYFFDPPDLRGMSILVVKPADENQADDNWIYLPALRRVRRISAAQKMDSFAGTDTTNDHHDRATGMWDMKITGETDLFVDKSPINNCYGSGAHRARIDGKHCVIVEMTPRNTDWPVSREVVYYDKAGGAWYFEETYDKGGRLIKTLLPFMAHMYPKEPRYWTYGDWYAQDLRTGHRSFMALAETDRTGRKILDYKTRDWSNYVFWYDTGYSDEFVSRRFMERGTR